VSRQPLHTLTVQSKSLNKTSHPTPTNCSPLRINHTHTNHACHSLTRLRELLDGGHDVQTVPLPGDDEVQLLEGLALQHQRVALGGEGLPLYTVDVVEQYLQQGRGGGRGIGEKG